MSLYDWLIRLPSTGLIGQHSLLRGQFLEDGNKCHVNIQVKTLV